MQFKIHSSVQITDKLNVNSYVFHLTDEPTTLLECHALKPIYSSVGPRHDERIALMFVDDMAELTNIRVSGHTWHGPPKFVSDMDNR
jgi:hypothetical protein